MLPPPLTSAPSRRRGGQPGNLNARVHGLYSAQRESLRNIAEHPDREASRRERTLEGPLPAIRHARTDALHPPAPISNSLILQSRIPNFPLSTFHFQRPSLPLSPSAANHQPPTDDLLPVTGDWSLSPLLSQHLHQNRLHLLRIAEITRAPLPLREMLAWSRAIHKLLSEHIRLARAIHRVQEPPRVLSRLARHLPRLVCLEFAQQGIREQPLFVPQEVEINDANSSGRPGELSRSILSVSEGPATSSPEGGTGHTADMSPRWGPVLTDSQWTLVGPTLESLREELDSERKYRRHIDCPEPRLLIQGILLKLAHGIPWNDLPDLFRQMVPQADPFPLRAARELYRQLYLSGRMAGIYRGLAWHLRLHGRTTAVELVESGAFLLDGPRIRLAPETELTWQAFTALLLLQRAFHNYRVFVRERTLERRHRGLYLCLPSLNVIASERTRERSNLPLVGTTLPPADIRSSEIRNLRPELTSPTPAQCQPLLPHYPRFSNPTPWETSPTTSPP